MANYREIIAKFLEQERKHGEKVTVSAKRKAGARANRLPRSD